MVKKRRRHTAAYKLRVALECREAERCHDERETRDMTKQRIAIVIQ